MEDNFKMTQQSSITPENKENKLFSLALLKVGLIEILFVVIALILLFGTLNYFNILPVSGVFPQLNWLPHREALPGTSQISPTPVTFQYDTKKAEQLLTQYIKDTLKPEFLPKNLDIQQGLSIDGRQEDRKDQFGTRFTRDNPSDMFTVNFHFQENSAISKNFMIFIEVADPQATTATSEIVNSLASLYFINPYNISACQAKEATSYCENFQTENDGKKGFGMFSVQEKRPLQIIFACFIPKESADYTTRQSCIIFP